MIVKQKLSILVLPKWKKENSEGKAPVYLRITIDGIEDGFSVGCKIEKRYWNAEFKRAESGTPRWQEINKKINHAVTDIERHFNLMVAKHGLVTPTMVKESYLTPISGQQLRIEAAENAQLGEELDKLISRYLSFAEKAKKAYTDGRTPLPIHQSRLDAEKSELTADAHLNKSMARM